MGKKRCELARELGSEREKQKGGEGRKGGKKEGKDSARNELSPFVLPPSLVSVRTHPV